MCLYDKEGERIGAVSIIRDITDRRKVEKELERHRSHLEDVVKERTEKLTKINKQTRNSDFFMALLLLLGGDKDISSLAII